jgi:superoxide dismutase, Fe-Mn family
MFYIARTALRPALSRSLVAPASSASLHTLPDLPYAYNVRYTDEQYVTELNGQPLGFGTIHL